MDVPDLLARGAVLVLVLLVIGWGFGLAAALIWRNVRGGTEAEAPRVRLIGLALGIIIVIATVYAYSNVIQHVTTVQDCFRDMPMPQAC